MNLKKIKDASVEEILKEVLWSSPDRVNGALCFKGTRLAIKYLYEYLDFNMTPEEFHYDFPDIPLDCVQKVVKYRTKLEDLNNLL